MFGYTSSSSEKQETRNKKQSKAKKVGDEKHGKVGGQQPKGQKERRNTKK